MFTFTFKLRFPTSLPSQEGNKSVINLTKNVKLTTEQLSLLSRGLNFIPTKGTNKDIIPQTKYDVQQYHRRLKLAAYYEHAPPSKRLPFILKSTWTPPKTVIPLEIETIIKADDRHFGTKFKVHHVPPNLSQLEIKALTQLKDNRHIVIKPADKGSSIVILDREQYLWEGYRQLNDTKYYVKLDKPIYLDTIPLVNKIIKSLHDKRFINTKQKHYLMGDSTPRARLFYMLPKIHKDPNKWSLPHKIPPGRPIVSDCSSETYHTAAYLDHFLNPLSTTHPSYIKDTYHFVNIVKGLKIPEGAILFTIDIDSLYTNIGIKEGLQAIKNAFLKQRNINRPDKELLQLLEINLTKNDFQFNDEWFLQIKGTAMGKKFAPAYANIFMAEWETSALQACDKKPLHYYRYLDDIWGVWAHSKSEFETFLNTLNTHMDSIKIKSTSSLTSVDFLDTTTFKGNNFQKTQCLDIKVFFKETDTHALLFKTSFHPTHTYAGLIKSQLLRFHRICTEQSDFQAAVKILFQALSTRGYSRSFRRRCFKTFLETKPITLTSGLPLITTYSPSTRNLSNHLRINFNKYTKGSSVLQNHSIIPAFRRNKNLQDFLVKAKIPPITKPKPKIQKEYFKHRKWLSNNNTGEIFKSLTQGDPHTKNCVYIISCKQCDLQYVGETGNTLSTRFAQHKYNITRRKNLTTPLVKHFLLHGLAALSTTVSECNDLWTTSQRKAAEKRWIIKLGTKEPNGLNEH